MRNIVAGTVFTYFHKFMKYPYVRSGGDTQETVSSPSFATLNTFEKESRGIVFIYFS
jgi:hypothetical protein